MTAELLQLEDLNDLAERIVLIGEDGLVDQLEAWGIDTESWGILMNGYVENGASHLAGLPLKAALAVVWAGGFELGYLSRLEVETRETFSVPDAIPVDD